MIVTGDLGPLFRPGLRNDFREELGKWEPVYTQFMKMGSTDKPENRATIIGGLNRLYDIGDGAPITYDRIKVGPVVQVVDREFGVGYALSRRAVEDDQYGKANQAAKFLGNAVNMTFEYRAAALLDDSFTGTTFKGIDTLRLCHTAHTCVGNDVTTFSNEVTTPIQLSVTGFENLLDLVTNTKDHNGDPMRYMPTDLIIGNASGQLHKAMQILGSDKEPFTANNQDNAIKKRLGGMNIIVNPYITSTTKYWMFNKKLNDVQFLMRRKPTFDSQDDFNTKALLNTVTTRFAIWFVDPRGWVGANAT